MRAFHLLPLLLLSAPALLAASSTTNFTATYPDGSSLSVILISEDGSILRIVSSPPNASAPHVFPLTVPQPPLPPNASFNVTSLPSSWLLTTTAATVVVSKTAATASIASPDGTPLSSEVQPVSVEDELQCGNGHGGPIQGGCVRAWRTLQPGERIFGFGVQFTEVDHTGTTKFIRTCASPSDQGLAHIPAPFFVSSLGYGVALNAHAYTYFDIGFAFPPPNASSDGLHLMHTADPVFDMFFFAGPGPKQVVSQYTALFGRTAMPPLFAMGLWYHPQETSNQSAVVATVQKFKDNGVPLAAVTLEPPWQTHAYSCTYVWNAAQFWDVPGLLSTLQSISNTSVSLWQHAYIYNASQGLESPLWDPIYNGGLASDWITWGGATPDWTLPATQSIVSAYMTETFVQKGIVAFKLDECDGNPPDSPPSGSFFFPDNASFPSGFTGAQMHNLFGLTYGLTYHSIFDSAGLRTFLKARANYMGGQRWPTTTYSDSYDYGQYLTAVLNSGFGGFTWSPEIRDAGNATEFARRSQLMLFSGLASEDGWNSGYAPFPPSVEPGSAAIFKAFYDQRAMLVPALYAAYAQQSQLGFPAVRSLILDFPNDIEALATVVDEYLFTSLLVAPAPLFGDSRNVYFPAQSGGQGWVDFFNPNGTKVYAPGTTASINTPDEILPVFQQVGSVVPLADLEDATLLRLRAVAPLTTMAAAAAGLGVPQYGPASEAAWIYDDDGRTTRYRTHGEFYRGEARIAAVCGGGGGGGSCGGGGGGGGGGGNKELSAVALSHRVVVARHLARWTTLVWEVALPGRTEALPQVAGVWCGDGWEVVRVAEKGGARDAAVEEVKGTRGGRVAVAVERGQRFVYLAHRMLAAEGEELECVVEFA